MANDTISRKAALAWCKKEDWGTPDERWRPESEYGRYIESLPTAERKGHWIELKCGSASLWKCSECGELFLEDFYYCPNCGADMRGEQ